RVEVEPMRVHVNPSIRRMRPLLAGAIPVQFDTIAVRVPQIERLADAVVAGSFERYACFGQPAQRIRELRTVRIQDRKMIKTCAPRRRRLAVETLPGVQTDVMVVATGRHEGCLGAVSLSQLESEHAAVEGDGPLEVGDFQVNVSDADGGMDGVRHKEPAPV